MPSPRPKVLVLAGLARSLINFRRELIRELQRHGDVYCAAPRDSTVEAVLAGMGVTFVPAAITRSRLDPIGDFAYWRTIRKLCAVLKPSLVLAYTVKPIVFGLSAARASGVSRRFALVTGLGYTFLGTSWRRRLLRGVVRGLYRWSLADAERVFFQNPDDRNLFVGAKLVDPAQADVVDGSGVDIEHFAPVTPQLAPLRFLLIARLLADKGIYEYAAAARLVKATYPETEFMLVGPPDPSPAAITTEEVLQWNEEGVVHYLGELTDVRPAIRRCSVHVLPSYREGLPRTNLEAMAMGRPVITTDVPGCRETVVPGLNGFLVPAGDPQKLAEAMLRFAKEPALVRTMGAHSRRMVEERYDVRRVNQRMLKAMRLTA